MLRRRKAGTFTNPSKILTGAPNVKTPLIGLFLLFGNLFVLRPTLRGDPCHNFNITREARPCLRRNVRNFFRYLCHDGSIAVGLSKELYSWWWSKYSAVEGVISEITSKKFQLPIVVAYWDDRQGCLLGDVKATKGRNLHQIQENGEDSRSGKRAGHRPCRQSRHCNSSDGQC
jgi:hypothetical protein